MTISNWKNGHRFIFNLKSYYKSGNDNFKSGQLLQIRVDLLQIGSAITNQGKYYKLVHKRHWKKDIVRFRLMIWITTKLKVKEKMIKKLLKILKNSSRFWRELNF